MPLRETEAIVLRTYRLGEADKIVSLFSRQMGRVRAVASGAQHPRSRFGGILESLTYIRLWLYERENRDLLRINSAELIESFFAMRSDYSVHLAGQYVLEASDRLLPEREVNERAFRLLVAVLRGLKAAASMKGGRLEPAAPAVSEERAASGIIDRPLAYFNYWLLKLGGFLPPLDRCGGCGQGFGSTGAYYGSGELRLACVRCRSGAESHKVDPAALALAGAMRSQPLDQWMAQAQEAGAAHAARLLFETWIEAAAEKKFVTRELLAQEDTRLE